MINKDFGAVIKDEANKVVYEEEVNSGDNGFLDFWLPKDKKYTIAFEYDGKVTESKLSTFKTDDTCITTIQLEK